MLLQGSPAGRLHENACHLSYHYLVRNQLVKPAWNIISHQGKRRHSKHCARYALTFGNQKNKNNSLKTEAIKDLEKNVRKQEY